VRPDSLLKDGDEVAGLRVIHIPGHTPGSIALYDGTLLFSGDTLNVREGRVQGPPPQYTADMRQAIASVRKLLSLKFDVLLPGHGDPVVGRASEKALQDLATYLRASAAGLGRRQRGPEPEGPREVRVDYESLHASPAEARVVAHHKEDQGYEA